jgi:hypothetical protein
VTTATPGCIRSARSSTSATTRYALSLPSPPPLLCGRSFALLSLLCPQAEAIKYYCPECTLKRRKAQNSGPTCAPLSARDLKHNSFSKYIEERCVSPPISHPLSPHSPTDSALSSVSYHAVCTCVWTSASRSWRSRRAAWPRTPRRTPTLSTSDKSSPPTRYKPFLPKPHHPTYCVPGLQIHDTPA